MINHTIIFFVCAEHDPKEHLENVFLRQCFLLFFSSSTPMVWLLLCKALFCVFYSILGLVVVFLLIYYIIYYNILSILLLVLLLVLLFSICFNFFIDLFLSTYFHHTFITNCYENCFKSLKTNKKCDYNVRM